MAPCGTDGQSVGTRHTQSINKGEDVAFIAFKAADRVSYGILRQDGVFDLGVRIGAVLPDLKTFLTAEGLGFVQAIPKVNTTDYGFGQFTYLPVIPNPGKILCVGLNYEEHRVETGRAATQNPAIFTRFADTLTGHNMPIVLPPNSTALDYEGELAVVIGRSGFRVKEEEALGLVSGFAIFNDATLRDWQRHTPQFTPGKNFPRTGAFGPSLLTREEAGALEEKRIETRLNGTVMQEAKLGDMIFSISRIIAYLTAFTRLSPGDVIATGTPGGVGFKREPQVFMKDGDRVEVTIDGFGTLVNTIEQEPEPDSNHVGN
jgi:2-keto-4-pentenoate hydratase/2-oxohepta-3-ene-1,7-dioic acid hydratase in catechol pathway